MPHIVIPIEHVPPSEVRDFLQSHLTEEEHHEPITHLLAERLGL